MPGGPSVYWHTTGWPSQYLQGILEHHWNLVETALHWNATGQTLTILAYTRPPLEKQITWNYPTMECHWRNSDYCSLHWNTTRGTHITHASCNAWQLTSSNVWVLQRHPVDNFEMISVIEFVYLGLRPSEINLAQTTLAISVVYIRDCSQGSDLTCWAPNQMMSVHWDTTE